MPKRKKIKTNYNTMAKRYELASVQVFDELPKWKQNAVIEDRQTGNLCSRIMNEFVSSVISLAENFDIELTPKEKPVNSSATIAEVIVS